MPRIVSVWLPQWPVHRWLAAERHKPSRTPIDPRAPFVLADGTDAPRIVALNPAAQASGLVVGETLADARARIGALQVRLAEPAADAKALMRLAQWATRYTPSVALFEAESGADGFFLDVTGATHLLGGEDKLLADLAHRLAAFGLPARLGLAETAGTAWAVSHHARSAVIVPAGAEKDALAPLPIEGLRLAPETALTLRRLGFKRIGDLIGKPRAPFAARFERELLCRLDQALGTAPEPLALLAPPPVYIRTRSLIEPISTEDAIIAVATRLMRDLAPRLEADGVGARHLRLSLYRVDGAVQRLDVGCTLPTQSPEHVARLIRLKLERLARLLEAGFGFETLSLAVTRAERIEPRQHALAAASGEVERARRCTALLDALRQRLGADSVRHLAPVASHWPERSEMPSPTPHEQAAWPPAGRTRPRPPLLLPRAEPADVIALMPDGPPQRVRWRGRLHTIAHAEGPERIAAEWWRSRTPQPTRDYYLVEDNAGRRLWLYREGIPGRETASARWFVHGLFA
jgi:protein ImuB